MKFKILVASLMLGLVARPVVATDSIIAPVGDYIAPPKIPLQVDATNFVINNYFSINFTNFFQPQLYTTDNTLNFTNNGSIVGNTGFQFDWFGKTNALGVKGHKLAANFVNNGTILCGSGNNTNTFFNLFLLSPGLPKLVINATNVSLRSSTNTVGVDGLIAVTGKNVDLNRAKIHLEGFEDTPTNIFGFLPTVPGMSAAYWGVGTNTMNANGNFTATTPFTPGHAVNLPGGFFGFRQLALPNAAFYVDGYIIGTNRFVQGVFIRNTNTSIINNVYFPFVDVPVVEWIGRQTNQVSGAVTTNLMYLADDFGTFFTNGLYTNFSYYTAAGTAIPFNYTFTPTPPFSFFGLGPAAAPASPIGIFDPVVITNEYAAFGAVFSPTTVRFDDLPIAARDVTNLPGRIQITADANLDMTLARISGPNYMGLRATNHVKSTSGARISVPLSDISLATTNGRLAITNLLYPVVQRFTGEVDLYSARWTNNFGGLSTTYAVLFVDSQLDSVAPSQVQDLTLTVRDVQPNVALRSTNVVISDILNVIRRLKIETVGLTITTNQQPAATPRGELNLLTSEFTWSAAFPQLRYLTNAGGISAQNALSLGDTTPYEVFVNSGALVSDGSLIFAKYFENRGAVTTRPGLGSLTLEATTAKFENGVFAATNGAVSIAASSLVISNSLLYSGRELSVGATDLLTDTGSTNVNNWYAGGGFSLTTKPAVGDLLKTTVSTTVPAEVEAVSRWAGEDRGCSTAGYTNNAALGRLILNGGDNSQFTFTPIGTGRAIYVDYLELQNFTTNRDAGGNFVGIQIDPEMKVYFAQAVANGVSIAEKLDKQNGGRFCWVSDYAGFYSSTNVIYPDGTTNLFNAALVGSCNLDSDGDGLVNCSDTTPILRPQDLALSVSLVTSPAPKAQVSWQSGPYAANTVYYSTNANANNWKVLTNFVSGAVGGRVSINDAVSPGGPRYYRVRVDSHQP